VGAITKSDTLVTHLFEWSTASLARDKWDRRTLDVSQPHFSPEAYSELDLACEYADTSFHPGFGDGWDQRPHIPLGLLVSQRSMSWSGAAIDDFVIMNYELTNIGDEDLKSVYCGLYIHGYYTQRDDNLTGFLGSVPSGDGCGSRDVLDLAYMFDNDGNPESGRFTAAAKRSAIGFMLLGSSIDYPEIGYNWNVWDQAQTDDWGPRLAGTLQRPFRSFNPNFAAPHGDRDLYYIMSHPTIDYDQVFAALDHTDEGWLPPPTLGSVIARGGWLRVYYSFGPFDLPRREKINFTIAVVGGDNVHVDPSNVIDPYQPQYFYDHLDFSELAENARWAQWVYDNPGVDTDTDGYFGEFRVCEGDTVWYKGDGVPDFRGNSPPPAPYSRVLTEPGQLVVRFNGFLSETTKDIFSGLVDFEGYRVYLGLDDRRSSLSLLTSYDRENFFRLTWNGLGVGEGKWVNDDPPYSLDSLCILYNDPNFDPLRYDRNRPLILGDSVFMFEKVDQNQYELGLPNGIRKAFPEAVDPGLDSTLWTESDITREHDGKALPKYYEYEYTIGSLLPTVPYFVAVTAFDFGYAGGRGNLPPDESNPLNSLINCYAQTSAEEVASEQLDAYVYPNPYRVDADYAERGYENRKGNIIPDRARIINFANLPPKCKISVFSLDGDLIGVRYHDYAPDDPMAMHDTWNLVSRSGLAVESGLYYWVVESEGRTQIGKLVIIK
jgi:hypothetical protein